MSCSSRLSKSFEGALRLPLNNHSKYILISDCHRGIGNSNDNFLKNQNLYFAALQHYYNAGYTCIELGDGDELWENRCMEQIIEAHENVFLLLSCFHKQNRLYMLYGNHDMAKKSCRYTRKHCSNCYCGPFYSGIILETDFPMDIYLTHGHQSDLFNSTLWRLSRFLVRYLWKPLEHFGVLDPTSAAKNYTRKHKAEERLEQWAKRHQHILITGHTHRPALSEEDPYYYNSGSCVHPYCITCLEIEHSCIRLVKWTLCTRADMTLYVCREVIGGPVKLDQHFTISTIPS